MLFFFFLYSTVKYYNSYISYYSPYEYSAITILTPKIIQPRFVAYHYHAMYSKKKLV